MKGTKLESPTLLAAAAGEYSERTPHRDLEEHFSLTWCNHVQSGSAAITVVPDGCIDLEWMNGELRVAGPDKVAHQEQLKDGCIVIGLRFRPGIAAAWLGVPASEIVDSRVPLEAYWGEESRRMADWVAEGRDTTTKVLRLETVVAQRARGLPHPEPLAVRIHHLASRWRNTRDLVPRLCSSLDVSERTLRRHCDRAFGYGPNTLKRILRFQEFLRRVHESSFAALALDLGYSDQAHLTREARALAGKTPRTVREQLVRSSSSPRT